MNWSRLCFLTAVSTFVMSGVCGSYILEDTPLHCSVRRSISPCTCSYFTGMVRPKIMVICQKMVSFESVIGALQNKFDAVFDYVLNIEYSELHDLDTRRFNELGFPIVDLKLTKNNLSTLPDEAFIGMNRIRILYLSDNRLCAVPTQIFKHMPSIEVLDLARNSIHSVASGDFQSLSLMNTFVMATNNLTDITNGSFPTTLRKVQLAANNLTELNGNLRNQKELEWLYLSNNRIKNLDGELPIDNDKLIVLDVSKNRLTHLPPELNCLKALRYFYCTYNQLTGLNKTLSKSRKLVWLELTGNKIQELASDEFEEASMIEVLELSNNCIKHLNKSLLPLTQLSEINLSNNKLAEFSLTEIKGLKELKLVDLSHNTISKLSGHSDIISEPVTGIEHLKLDHNELDSLGGSLIGIKTLVKLNISHNKFTDISPYDLTGLNLKILDVSHNLLHILPDSSQIHLPALETLVASYNVLTGLSKDFQGYPVLCHADLEFNSIQTIQEELVEMTQCKLHGVNSTLRIYLEGNPVLCDDNTKTITKAMELKYNAEVSGTAKCIPVTNDIKISNLTEIDQSPITVIVT
ncbi:leucine-rich repeat-containing G-protein coupled receptor 4-like [Rhopalosiphum maidis]|uniref:leucine-rich repeat-containing G-protein coupled receptor 4-like n=1 Tax=Rhopalosiphum maidis TaxID=43146 RepID=UPI000EFFD697|nr:leucine-rich repeat-containing G-protein coupled receptor 4-like [Rhopalosiphum maidis]XP_026823387.1 leucine-rich repeat-containing G-protein coupled receptor 4-like [Rhopalosiphum maidis]XP_026823388.1 leucine-rich repeat-containing G-protein coupled receptor 4-like [Rhopalosiphum maidis]